MKRGWSAIAIVLLALVFVSPSASAQVPAGCPATLGTADIVEHDLTVSFCELCEVGDVRIEVVNPFSPGGDDIDFDELRITEDLRASGLTYVANSTNFSGNFISVPTDEEPLVAGADLELLTWDLRGDLTMLARPGGSGNKARLFIDFQVRRNVAGGFDEEGLVRVPAPRTIEASVELAPSCALNPLDRFTTDSGPELLPLQEPLPELIKTGRNVDAGQGVGSYDDEVYGHEDDDVIWRIEVRNNGNAPLQDVVFDDSIIAGNFAIHSVCDNEPDATAAAATSSTPAGCVAPTTSLSLVDFDVRVAFGGTDDPYIVAPAGGSGFYYLIGEITSSCDDRDITVSGFEFGCQSQPGVGGLNAPSSGVPVAPDTASLGTESIEGDLQVVTFLEGVNRSQPMGARGTVTVRIRNLSGGTIYHPGGIELENVLPEEYVVDATFAPQLLLAPAYGNSYDGFVDELEWLNPAPAATPLANTTPRFRLTSSSDQQKVGTPDRSNMIRHGDTVRIRFRTVLIEETPRYYDTVADLDVREEDPNSDPPGTDPIETFPIDTTSEIWYYEFCSGHDDPPSDLHNPLPYDDDDDAEPEDLDIDVVGTEIAFILTSTGDPLPLSVALTNNGGHDATDYLAWVTFGEAMTVSTVAAGCSAITNPPPPPVWQQPTTLPDTAAVYLCDRGTISPGETETLDFEVVKNTAATFDDDLTFRADVIGEIRLFDGTLLDFPAPLARTDGILDAGNNYSNDAVWARVVGFDLFKAQLGTCTENNPPPGTPDDQVQIGEECSFDIESGGWFGFETPGFTYIAVQDIQVVDPIPDGQAYISSSDPDMDSTDAIEGISFNPPPAPLDEGSFDWTFNEYPTFARIEERDHWFRVDVTTRLLNDQVDLSAPPNEHAALSTNILDASFQAVFFNDSTMEEEVYNLGAGTVGFPREVHRRVDLTVTEPNLIVTKEVCNETLYGAGLSCGSFVDLADDGDAFDTYVYRITVANEAASGGVPRAPAYDVTVTSVADPSDELFVIPLPGDGVDNDGDGLVDAGDAAGEGTITDNTVQNAIPAEVIASYTHSDDLLRIDAGDSVVLYYRVDPNDDVAPLQALTSTVTASYDSLEGDSGAQTPPVGVNGDIEGARQYVSAADDATIQIIAVEVSPKRVVQVANSALVAPPQPQPVSIGEEVEFELQALIPVAQLRNFMVRDELPPGLSCAEAPDVDLDELPYSDAKFDPGGIFTPTCTPTEVVWDFGDQTITESPRDDRRFDFAIQFIARVDNEAANQDGLVIVNGGAATVTNVSYVDEGGGLVTIPIESASLIVQEPVIDLTKAFSVAQADAADLPRVTVTATNNGTATAYNLRVLDDLSAVDLTYANDIQGASPPTADLVTVGPDAPLFSWPPGFAIAPGETVSFSFAVSVDAVVEPLQVLANTVQADWTSLPAQTTALNSTGLIGVDGAADGMRIGALPNAGDALNDYEAEASASVPVPGLILDKLDLDPGLTPAIGAHKPFELVIELPEGVTQALTATDSLDTGAVSYVLADNADFDVLYTFEGIATINGQPPSEAALSAVPADGTSGSAVWTIGTVVTATEDDLATQAITPTIRIRYHGRVNNDLVTDAGDTLQNSVLLEYRDGETGLTASETDDTPAITAVEPALTATKVLTNVTAGKAAGDPAAFNDTLQYVVTIVNGGTATAYDVNVVDTLPPELELSGGFAPTATIGGAPVGGFVSLPTGNPVGPLVWGRGNGDDSLDIPAGSGLALTYQVSVVVPPTAGVTIDNNVWTDWTSLQGVSVYERDGDGCPVITPPDDYCFGPAVAVGNGDPLDPPPLLKENTQATAAVGEAFTWRVTIPETPYGFPLYDVRILDDLTASAADLRLLGVTKVAGSGAWTPVNSGTPTNAVLEDTTVGIDIPADEQVVLDLLVVLEDTLPPNASGLTFTNTASYLYNWRDGDFTTQLVGDPGTSQPMTIVGPDVLNMTKTGPASMVIGTPEVFTLDVHNAPTGPAAGPAWNLTITDQLPDGATGGMCDAAPTNVVAQVFEADGTTPVSAVLVDGTDYTTAFVGAPTCEFTLTVLTAAGTIGADQRLIVTYEAQLDAGTQNAAGLINVAGATEWFSADGSNPATAGDRRTYTEVLTNGTVGMLDHEDAHTVTAALPPYFFEKTVMNVTTGEDPATSATPGDTLLYRFRFENQSTDTLDEIAIVDELDRLNDPAVFVPGTLTLVTVPPGADITGTSATGGPKGTGLLDVRDLSVLAGETLLVELEITLEPVIANGTVVTNQSQLSLGGVPFADSDDPVPNGRADPFLAGDEDPTEVPIVSAPNFEIEKISAYVTGSPAVLLAGETLRYTITVKNVGTDDAVDAVLRDDVPANTTYVAGSTTLNGSAVADGPGGVSPLANGLLLYAPEDPTPGAMRADVSATPDNVATVVFDVVVDPGVPDGTVISNQGFVSAVAGGVSDQPSDDPRTPVPDDPTRDVVGNSPLLFAPKSVVIGTDGGTIGQVDPLDILHYTITVFNTGAVPATGALLTDAVPANTTYVPGSTTLNTIPVPDGAGAPLAAGVPISSSDLTPPLPGPGLGVINPGQSAVLEFDLEVNGGVAAGTVISNQATVTTVELANLLTDGDGNPATGPEPTVVVVGDGQQLAITKQVAVVGGGAALAGGELEYVVRVTNVATVPAMSVEITDDLDVPVAGYLTYVPGSATLDGVAGDVAVAGNLLTADYSAVNGPLPPGGSTVLRFRATIAAGLAIGTTITNTATVNWNTTQSESASVSIDVGGMPGVGMLNGSVWHDADFDASQDGPELALAGWTVALYRNGVPVQSAVTSSAGAYSMGGLTPNDANGDQYELRFSAPGSGANTASLGFTSSAFTNGPQQISDLVVPSGSNLQNLDLPIDPNGVVYDAIGRFPVVGATLTMMDAAGVLPLPSGCFDDPAQQGQVTLDRGYYKFDLNFSNAAACPDGGSYLIEVVPPGAGFVAGYSQIIPPTSGPATAALSVPGCPTTADDAIPATAQFCESQPSEFAPPSSVAPRTTGTRYHVHLQLAASPPPGSSQIFNNHIPIDPELSGAVGISKTSPQLNVSRGQLVPYEIVINNELGAGLLDLDVIDRFPAGFHYVEGSARIDGVPSEPTVTGRELVWPALSIPAASTTRIVLLLAVGAGVSEGEYVNRAEAINSLTGGAVSGEARATVRVVPDPTFSCTDVMGKVFDDANRNGLQDPGEKGLAGVRLVTVRGLAVTTDAHGRYHVTCAVNPRDGRGNNFVLKLDDRTLPSGYRMSTRQTQVQRATRGKALRLNYAASIHRVVALDMADAVFEPDTTQMRAQWKPRLGMLLDELRKSPAVLRLSYVADLEDETLVAQRLDAIKDEIRAAWEGRGGRYELTIEPEVFWRRGAPVDASETLGEAPAAQAPAAPSGAADEAEVR